MKRKTLLEKWNDLEQEIEKKNTKILEEYFLNKDKSTKAYCIGSSNGIYDIQEIIITKWDICHFSHDKRNGIVKPYREWCNGRYRNPTKIKVDELDKYVKIYSPNFEDVGFGYERIESGWKATGFKLVTDMIDDKYTFSKDILQEELKRMKDLYEPKDGYIRCDYCRKYRKPEDIHRDTIISPNWARTNYTSPLRNYCKDTDCHIYDQMGHEG